MQSSKSFENEEEWQPVYGIFKNATHLLSKDNSSKKSVKNCKRNQTCLFRNCFKASSPPVTTSRVHFLRSSNFFQLLCCLLLLLSLKLIRMPGIKIDKELLSSSALLLNVFIEKMNGLELRNLVYFYDAS